MSFVTIDTGYAGYYSHGVMRDVVLMRQSGNTAMSLPKDLPPVIGFVAVKDCDRVGQMVALWHESEGWTFPYLIADCANVLENHDKRMERLDIIIDVDFNTVTRWRKVGWGGTEDTAIDVMMVWLR